MRAEKYGRCLMKIEACNSILETIAAQQTQGVPNKDLKTQQNICKQRNILRKAPSFISLNQSRENYQVQTSLRWIPFFCDIQKQFWYKKKVSTLKVVIPLVPCVNNLTPSWCFRAVFPCINTPTQDATNYLLGTRTLTACSHPCMPCARSASNRNGCPHPIPPYLGWCETSWDR